MSSIEERVSSASDPGPGRERVLLHVERLSKYFAISSGFFSRTTRLLRAVDDVSLHLRRGETLGLVGESGCGKSTLGRLLLRLIDPTSGRIAFDGNDLTTMSQAELRPLRRRMQMVFQDPYSSLNPRMTVREIVGEGPKIHGLARGRADLDARVADVLGKVGLRPDMHDRYPHEFSGGQRQRIGIARALAVGPEMIVCDEPTSALDVSIQAQIINLLQDLQEQLGLAYVLISHDLKLVEYMAQRVAVMYLGRIVETGPVGELYEKRYHPYTRALLSAIPVPDPARRHLRVLVEGDPPSPLSPPSGCAFHPRCPRAEPGRCDVDAPPLTEVVGGSGHQVACWLPGG